MVLKWININFRIQRSCEKSFYWFWSDFERKSPNPDFEKKKSLKWPKKAYFWNFNCANRNEKSLLFEICVNKSLEMIWIGRNTATQNLFVSPLVSNNIASSQKFKKKIENASSAPKKRLFILFIITSKIRLTPPLNVGIGYSPPGNFLNLRGGGYFIKFSPKFSRRFAPGSNKKFILYLLYTQIFSRRFAPAMYICPKIFRRSAPDYWYVPKIFSRRFAPAMYIYQKFSGAPRRAIDLYTEKKFPALRAGLYVQHCVKFFGASCQIIILYSVVKDRREAPGKNFSYSKERIRSR